MNSLKRLLQIVGHLVIVLLLTVITQVGGIIWLLAFLLNSKWGWLKAGRRKYFTFITLYLIFALVVIPMTAPWAGRVPLPIFGANATQLNVVTVLCNRHYVKPGLKEMLHELGASMQEYFPKTKVVCLDANFPFFDGFPLLPHLSHDDGRKVDLAFYYQSESGMRNYRDSPSWIGYGTFERPMPHEQNTTKQCLQTGSWWYSLTDYLVSDWFNSDLILDEDRTAALIRALSNHPSTGKLLLEPHLVARWKVAHYKVRFQGCHAVRHDDHIHVQL